MFVAHQHENEAIKIHHFLVFFSPHKYKVRVFLRISKFRQEIKPMFINYGGCSFPHFSISSFMALFADFAHENSI